MRSCRLILTTALLLFTGFAHAEAPALRIAVLKFGTVNWLMDTISRHGLDSKEGYKLEVVGLAGKAATTIAFQSGDADLMVTDWVWALRQREKGVDLGFSPYSVALGALMTRGDVDGLCDLRGRKVGIVGGEFDKSWLVLQALARKDCGFELAAETEALFGAPPLMSKQLQISEVDAVSTFWHWAAKMEAAGNTRLLGVTDALAALGIEPAPSLIGFVWNRTRGNAKAVAAFLRSVRAAQTLLADDDAEWEVLRPRMKPKDDKAFITLRDHFRAGIPGEWGEADLKSAGLLHQLLIDNAPPAFKEQAGVFDESLFAAPAVDGG